MKKSHIKKSLQQLEASIDSLKELNVENENIASQLKNQEALLARIAANEETMIKLLNDYYTTIQLVRQMNKSYASLLQKVGDYQEKINAIYQIIDTPGFRNLVDQNTNSFATVYTDASYNDAIDICGYGFVVESENGAVCEYNGILDKLECVDNMTSTIGEAYCVIKALETMDSLRYNDVVLYTDNVGVVDWANGNITKPSECSKWFVDSLNNLKQYMNITILWMRRCSCEQNTRADKLARAAVHKDKFIRFEENMASEDFSEAM